MEDELICSLRTLIVIEDSSKFIPSSSLFERVSIVMEDGLIFSLRTLIVIEDSSKFIPSSSLFFFDEGINERVRIVMEDGLTFPLATLIVIEDSSKFISSSSFSCFDESVNESGEYSEEETLPSAVERSLRSSIILGILRTFPSSASVASAPYEPSELRHLCAGSFEVEDGSINSLRFFPEPKAKEAGLRGGGGGGGRCAIEVSRAWD